MAVIKYCILAQDKVRLILGLFVILWSVAMLVARTVMLRKEMNMTIWRLLCLAPLLLCIIHFAMCYFKGSAELNLRFYAPIYCAAIALAILQFRYGRDQKIALAGGVVIALAVVGMAIGVFQSANGNVTIGNFSRCNYEDAMRGILAEMREHYCLNDWKEIDYEALEERMLPQMQAADEQDDAVAFYMALCEYRYYFYDWHLILTANTDRGREAERQGRERLAGYDHGFAMFTLDSGETVAIMTDRNSAAYRAGIQDGTRILRWNGVPVEEAAAEVQCIYPDYGFSVKENEDRVKAVFLAGRGGETVTVTYLDAEGMERSVALNSMGSYRERLENTLDRFYRVSTLAPEDERNGNYYTRMLTSDIGYLRIERESYHVISDAVAMVTGHYEKVTDMLDRKLVALRNAGMTSLVIDVRNNRGGSDDISGAVATLFTDEKLYNYGFGEYIDGEYITTQEHWVNGNGKWKELPVVLLVNSECLSAGDRLASLLGECPNVQVVGMTVTNGIDQNPTATCVTPNSDFLLRYPSVFSLSQQEGPNNDTRADRESRMVLDRYIPITEEAVLRIFREDADYELEYVVDLLRE